MLQRKWVSWSLARFDISSFFVGLNFDVHGLFFSQIGLPTRIRKWTVRRSTFKYGKSKEHFEMRIYNRLLQFSNASPKTLDTLLKYTEQTVPAGVGIRITEFLHRKLEIPSAKHILSKSK